MLPTRSWMSKKIYLVGCGGHGRVVLDALLAAGMSVAGIADPALMKADSVFGIPVMGGNELLDGLDPATALLANGLGANPDVSLRRKFFEDLVARGFSFARLVHPSVVTGRDCTFGDGSQVMAGVVLQYGVVVGVNAVINTRASVDHGCEISAHAFVSPGAVLTGNVSIGDSAFIGAGAVVLPGVKVGARSIVGAGAMVHKDVPEGWMVAGNPAKRIGDTG